MTIEVLDPTFSEDAAPFERAARPTSLAGMTIGIVSNGKQGTVPFFESLSMALRDRHGVADVVKLTKGNYSAPAEVGVMDQAKRWGALIAGVGD